MSLSWLHPVVREWFETRFGTPTEPQVEGWPHILAGRSTLISAPTGSGKTLTAFLACIDRLVRQAAEGTLQDRTEVLYISPLKALGNDIQRNLDGPLAEIQALARERGIDLPLIRTAVRTGDTLMPERQKMLRTPPHILVTTPESLFILLTAEKSRAILRDVRTVIVDEIHAMVDDKRGSHLSLSLERLDKLAAGATEPHAITRIGLSATQKPIDDVARFLAGAGRPEPVIVQIAPRRTLDLAIEVPLSELGPVATHELWDEIYNRLAALAQQHRSTLIFVNTRRLSERVTHHLAERLGAEAVAAHHGSLARKTRLDAEQRLKHGQLKALVATASLELGLDIGHVDLVCQIGSTRSIAVAVQRIGRAGHWRGAVPKGRVFPTTRDELLECAALVQAIRAGDLDRLIIPDAPLDVLAQQIVAMCATDDWDEDALFDAVRHAYPYRDLARAQFDEIVAMLSEGISAKRGRYGAYLHRDAVNKRLRGRRGARLAAITSGGAIPDNALYSVVAEPEGTPVGTVDEDFAVESLAGDIMLLGNTSWRIRRVSMGRVIVEDAHGAAPTIPFWRGEAPARTNELSAQVAQLREEISTRTRSATSGAAAQHRPEAEDAVTRLIDACGLDRSGAEQLVDYVIDARTILGVVPTQQTIVAERFFDEGGGMQLVIHAPFGARVNKAWGLALRKRFCRSFNFELQAAATDNGINIALAEQHSFPLADVFHFLKPATTKEVLEQAALASPIFGTRWRWDASRSLALLRFQGGKKVPIHIQRLRSDDLLASVFPDVAACQENIEGDIQIPDHPLIREVMKDVLTEAMDLDGLLDVLQRIKDGTITCVAVDTPVPSVFSHEILNANPYAYLDDAPLEERRARAVELRRVLPDTVLEEVGRLDPDAIDEVAQDAWPDVRSADDLHDALLSIVLLPIDRTRSSALDERVRASVDTWTPWFEELARANRTGVAIIGDRRFWIATERVATAQALAPALRLERPLPPVGAPDDQPMLALVRGWMGHIGPSSAPELSALLGLGAGEIDEALLKLESQGWALRGQFRPAEMIAVPTPVLEWCERRLLARVHRLTLGRLRREIAPVTAAEFMRWLLDWQHLTPGTQTNGERGTIEVLRQLQGFEAPASAWERQILARRIREYDPAVLDQLCLTGVVGWGRLSPHPATIDADTTTARRVIPTSVAPITFFVRDDAEWMSIRQTPRTHDERALSRHAREVLHVLSRGGASFFADIVRQTRQLKAEVETALWELVAAGLVTADGFDNLRALIDPKRRAGEGHGKHARPRHSTGRWSLLYSPATDAPGADAAAETHARDERTRAIEATCWMLLRRYGVVFRELLSRETLTSSWRDVLIALRRLEDRGEIRGGRFVSGFLGEQFALPVAIESLRARRHRASEDEAVTVAAADPLNLVGIVVPGERVASNSGRTVRFHNGVAEISGEPARISA
jgi:ATP-dependent Lhr-like helicase